MRAQEAHDCALHGNVIIRNSNPVVKLWDEISESRIFFFARLNIEWHRTRRGGVVSVYISMQNEVCQSQKDRFYWQ
jgi:hypothetical protein